MVKRTDSAPDPDGGDRKRAATPAVFTTRQLRREPSALSAEEHAKWTRYLQEPDEWVGPPPQAHIDFRAWLTGDSWEGRQPPFPRFIGPVAHERAFGLHDTGPLVMYPGLSDDDDDENRYQPKLVNQVPKP